MEPALWRIIQLQIALFANMKKTRNLLCLLLACLLVAIQQFGFAHALTHVGNPPENTSRKDKQHPAERVCIECVAFAQIGSGLTGTVCAAPPAATAFEFAPVRAGAFSPVFLAVFRSRAPPIGL